MELTRLRHIVAVARHQSFSRAAEEEGITQPALSRSIATFEQRHGVILFDRGRGGVYPTAAGHYVIEQAKKLLAAAEELEHSLKRYPDSDAGQIAIGLGPLLAGLFLPCIGSSLLHTWPGIRIKTLVRTPDELIAELLSDRIEMILGNNWNLGRMAGTEIDRLGTVRVSMMARGDHPLAKAGTIRAADLEAYPLASAIDLPPGSRRGHAGSFVCDNFHVLRETVLRSDCVWISSPAFLSEDLREGRMAQLDVADIAPADVDLSLISKRGRTRSPAAAAVVEEVRALLGDAPSPSRPPDSVT